MNATCTTPEPISTPTESALPSVKEVRSHFDDDAPARSTFKGLVLFAVPAVVYVAAFVGFVLLPQWPAKIACAIVVCIAIPSLFVIGHDACHGALTPHSWLNKILGRLAMLPSLHCYSVWDYGHNGLHHGYTNVRGKDQVFTPLSKADYDRLPRVQQILQRIYRTSIGLGLYYLLEMWAHFGILQKHPVPAARRRTFALDRSMVFLFLALQVVIVLLFSRVESVGPNFSAATGAWLVAIGVIIPFLFWNWTMGFVIYQHHTHPKVPWYADVEDWSFFAGQVRSVVSVELPAPIEIVLHNIMDHTAHHVDPKIPLYNLPNCQRQLEDAYGNDIVVVKWTFKGFFDTLKRCRLYDYENHRWLNFDGKPTTEKLI